MSLTVTTRVAMAHLRRRQLNPPAWPHPTATSPANPTTTSAVRGEASLVRRSETLRPDPVEVYPNRVLGASLRRKMPHVRAKILPHIQRFNTNEAPAPL